MPDQSVSYKPQAVLADPLSVAAPASHTAAVCTYPAIPGKCHVLHQIFLSIDIDPTALIELKVEDGSGNKVFSQKISKLGAYAFTFVKPMQGTVNTAMIITCADPGTTQTVTLSCTHESVAAA